MRPLSVRIRCNPCCNITIAFQTQSVVSCLVRIPHRSSSGAAFQEVDPLVGDGDYVVTASDDGKVRLFNYPCVVEEAPCR